MAKAFAIHICGIFADIFLDPQMSVRIFRSANVGPQVSVRIKGGAVYRLPFAVFTVIFWPFLPFYRLPFFRSKSGKKR